MAEELQVEKVNGVIVAAPAERTTFFVHRVPGPLGIDRTEVTPLVLPKEKMEGIIEAIKHIWKKKEAEVV